MKYVIWGSGSRGGRLFRHLKEKDVVAFVDKNSNKIGERYYDKPIISLNEYIEKYKHTILVITHTFEEQAIEELESLGIKTYMRLSDCAGEFQEENTRPYLCDYIKSIVNNKETYGIRGCTVYGLEVYSWLIEAGNNHSYIILDQSTPSEITELLKKNGYRILTENELDAEQVDSILNCKYIEEPYSHCTYKGINQLNIFDCSDVIKEYYNPAIEKFKGIHQNERCFIVATGPSLK